MYLTYRYRLRLRRGQYRSLTAIRAEDAQGYGALPVTLSRWTLKKADRAFQSFFARCKAKNKTKNGKAGFPRFKSVSRFRSFGFAEFSGVRLDGGRLKFADLSLKLHLHRERPQGASIRSCVLSRDDKGWRVALQLALPEVATVHPAAGRAAGMDWGVATLATLFDGEKTEEIENPRLAAAQSAEIARAQRKLARRKKSSRRREQAKAHLRALRRHGPQGLARTQTRLSPMRARHWARR